ncbi:hypothetical protein ACVV7M_002585 [Vibrio vulnificus]|uniref:hypothetical protein n=1 Tax=Vibrio vulnificus TaxID=672 RepID=UPI0005F11C97|nr:hypothetical protein [Vibrio vulnificus]ANN28826.1 hypothetical protein FORC17_3763 [Vibrio vulnificus]EGQ7928488.1 hypothetical protein [Vibrio vulnificus]EHU4942440.1 hypothetical protein [Vibrio vulnificus]EIN9355943.1 hypothetical protein [Vibrio vulnificus]EIU7746446.1 hypothetical protein [Vibrio vulnificus]
MITGIFALLTGGLEAYRQHNQNKANELKRKDEFEQERHTKQLERVQAGDLQASNLDELSIKTRGWKDEFLFIFFIPIVMCFIPGYAQYVHQGFVSLQAIPEPYWWVIGAIVIDTLGMRSMIRYLLEYFSNRFRGK